jgi:hypothetical protein
MELVPQPLRRRARSRPTALDLALSRAVVLGLSPDTRRVLHWGSDRPETTHGLASLFGDAVAVDPAGGVRALEAHAGTFDLALGDLTGTARVRRADLDRVGRALVGALRPGGMALVRLPPAGRSRRLRGTAGAADLRRLRAAVTTEGAEVVWAGADSEGSVWLYVVATPHHLSLVRGTLFDSRRAQD